jgi:hypothetical protein
LADIFISPLFTKGEGRAAVKISGEIKQRMQRSTILMMSAGADIFNFLCRNSAQRRARSMVRHHIGGSVKKMTRSLILILKIQIGKLAGLPLLRNLNQIVINTTQQTTSCHGPNKRKASCQC